MYKFKVGDKVKCVSPSLFLLRGEIYTIKEILGESCIVTNGVGETIEGGWYLSRFELVNDIWQDKPQWEVGRWYPRQESCYFGPHGTFVDFFLIPSGLKSHYMCGRDNLPRDWAAFKIVSYPKKKVKKTIERWAIISSLNSFITTCDSLTRAKKDWPKQTYVKLTGEYEIEEGV